MFFIKAVILCFLCVFVHCENEPRLWFTPSGDITSGDSVMIACRVTSFVLPVTWSKNGVDVFTTSRGPTEVVNLKEPLFGSMFGRFITTLRGGILHHVILTTNQNDDGVKWQCRQNLTKSTSVVMKVGQYTEASSSCGDSAGCILGISTALVLLLLGAVFIFHLYKQHDKSTRKGSPEEEGEKRLNSVAPVPNAVSNGEPPRKTETKLLINEKL